MNIQKFTQKSVEAINNCEKLAYDYGNQEIEQEHLLVALLQQEEGLIPKLIEKMEIDVQHFTQNAISKLDARVKVSGSNSNVYVGKDLNNVLIHAEDEAKAMGDEYVSVEHIFLAMLKYPNPAMKALMKEYGLTRERFLQALSTVRGNQRGIDGALVEGVEAHDGVSALVVDVLDGLRNALAQVAALVAIATLPSLGFAGGSTGRNEAQALSTVIGVKNDLDGRVAAGIENLTRVNAFNYCHNYSL